MTKVEFSVELIKSRNSVRLCVPPDLTGALGSARLLPAIVTVRGQSVRTTLHKISGGYMMSVNKVVQQQLGVTAGDTVHVRVEPDTERRTIELPHDLRTALADTNTRAPFDTLTPFRQNELLRSVTSAKKPETRARRIEAAVRSLGTSDSDVRH